MEAKLKVGDEDPILSSKKENGDDFFEKWSNAPISYDGEITPSEEEIPKSSTPQLLVALSAIVVLIAILTVLLLKLS